MIALGFTSQNRRPIPAGLRLIHHGCVDLIWAAPELAETTHHRLTQIVRCFQFGLDILPFPPAVKMLADDMKHDVQLHDIELQISRLSNKGQFTVRLDGLGVPNRSQGGADGRKWLAERRQHHLSEQHIKHMFQEAVADTETVVSACERSGRTLTFHLLLHRQDEKAVKRALTQSIKSCEALSNQSVTVTGLWPPLSFTDLPKPCERVA